MTGRLVLLLLCFALAACGSIEKPFKPKSAKSSDWTNSLAEPSGGYDIRVEPVDGPARPMAMLLAQSVVDSLVEKEVAATVNKTSTSRYVLRGAADANWGDPRAPFIIIIHWVLFDAKDNAVGKYSQGVRGEWSEWENGDPNIIRTVGQEAAQPFAEMVQEKEEIAPPAELSGSALMVKDVTGAPGDGNASLTAAIKEALTLIDVSVTEDHRQMDFALQGVVETFAPRHGKQKVRLTWTVLTLAGTKVGSATQENAVSAGSLDGVWGKTASLIASAAIGGIEDILNRAGKLRAEGGGKAKKEYEESSKGADETRKKHQSPQRLKQIPGKAPPPPI